MNIMICVYCGGDFGKSTGRGGYQYADGRPICTDCHKSAIKEPVKLQRLWNFVDQEMARLGYLVNLEHVPVTLLDQKSLYSEHGVTNVVGLAITSANLWQTTYEVVMMYGVPTVNAIAILAHEAAHVYCRQQHKTYTREEEGFCEFVAYSVLQRLNTAESQRLAQHMCSNPDPVYGGGLRKYLSSCLTNSRRPK